MKLTWLNKNYKWLVPVLTVLIIITYLLASSNLGKTSADLAQAYADKDLYQEAINKANRNTLGTIKNLSFCSRHVVLFLWCVLL